ncbi:MAG: hypothetical protein ACE367_25215 [Acidimicrobiales bacterium]
MKLKNLGLAVLVSVAAAGCGGAGAAGSGDDAAAGGDLAAFCELGKQFQEENLNEEVGDPPADFERWSKDTLSWLAAAEALAPDAVRADVTEALTDAEQWDAVLAEAGYDVAAVDESVRVDLLADEGSEAASDRVEAYIASECSPQQNQFQSIDNDISS